MATSTFPPNLAGIRRRWVAVGIVVAVVAVISLVVLRPQEPQATAATVSVTRGPIVASIAGTGTTAADRALDLRFPLSGTVAEVLVAAGDTVAAGQPLARLDTRDLLLQVASAEAGLESVRARLEQRQAGNATPEQLAAQRAAVASAEAGLERARTGNVTAADIAGAEAQLRAAQAQLDALRSPSSEQVSAAELAVTLARTTLQSTRDRASAAKTGAALDMQRAVDALTEAQSRYATALQQWEFVRSSGNDPLSPTTAGPQGRPVDNTLNDAQRQQYYDGFVRAAAALRSAEAAVEQARVAYDSARQQEALDVQDAEARLGDAEQQLQALRSPSRNALAQQQAAVDQARASLQRLRQGGTPADIAAAQAGLDQARANLAALTAPATASDLRIEAAAVAQAEQALAQARLALAQAELSAPFAGVITGVAIVPGSVVGADPVIDLLDRDPLHVDLRLSENDVARVDVGMPVALSFDALPGIQLAGAVGYIAPAAEDESGVITYRVRVDFADVDPAVKVGMTANLAIVYAEKPDALLVPTSALLPDGAGYVVQVPGEDGEPQDVPVTIGLSDDTSTEILSGLSEGQQVIAAPGQGGTSGGGLFGQ